jgi:hypothetical protein
MPVRRTPKAAVEAAPVPAPVLVPAPVPASDPEPETHFPHGDISHITGQSDITITAQEGLTMDELPFLPDEGDEYASALSDYESGESEEGAEPATRLIGEALLQAYNAGLEKQLPYAEIAKNAGYVSVTTAGKERVMVAQFNAALLRAEGHSVGSSRGGTGRAHLGLSRARVGAQGTLLVSQLATRHIEALPGDCFSVTYPGSGQILLTPTGENEPVAPRKKRGEEGEAEQPGTPLLDSLPD